MTPSHVHVAMDLIEGGNLAVRYRFEGEERAAVIVRQIIRALRYLHDNHIAVCVRCALEKRDKKALWFIS